MPTYVSVLNNIGIGSNLGIPTWNPQKLTDGQTAGWYTPLDKNGSIKDVNGVESVYWDMTYGNKTLGVEQNSGSTVVYAVYLITACQENFFYTGCQVGDTFVCAVAKTCSANNKVKKYTGNHLTQIASTKCPVNGVFDGVDDFMQTVAIPTLRQPESIYMVLRIKTWTNTRWLIDGSTLTSGSLSTSTTPGLVNAVLKTGSAMSTPPIPIDEFVIIRYLINGAQSFIYVNKEHDFRFVISGVENMLGITLGCRGGGQGYYPSNIEVKELIVRSKLDTAEDNANIYNYLSRKYSIDSPITLFDKGKVLFEMDATQDSLYDVGLPIFIDKGIKTSMYVESEVVGLPGYMTWAKVHDFANNQCDIQNHPQPELNNRTVQQVVDILNNNAAVFVNQGFNVPQHIAYMAGLYDANTIIAMGIAGVKTARIVSNLSNYKNVSKYELRGINMGKSFGGVNVSVGMLEGLITLARQTKTACILYLHGVDDTEVNDLISAANLTSVIDYAKAESVDIITISEFGNLIG